MKTHTLSLLILLAFHLLYPVIPCPAGQFLYSPNSTCLACPDKCTTCTEVTGTTNGNCTSGCSTGYNLVFSPGRCCKTSCSSCTGNPSNASQCTTCPAGQFNYTQGPYCQFCPPSCTTCYEVIGSPDGVCTSCASGTSIMASIGTCCNSSLCATCGTKNISLCSSCASGEFLSGTSCVASCPSGTMEYNSTCVSSCPAGTYNDLGTPAVCQSCDSTCATCSGSALNQCLTCTSPRIYTPSQNTCPLSCPAGTFNNSGTCQVCDSTCATCSGSLSTQCLTCASPRAYSSGSCVNPCPTGTYDDLGTPPKCQLCDSTCTTCSGSLATQCLTCASPRAYSSGSCVNPCPTGTYNDLATPPTCQNCDSTCKTCSGHLSTQCLTCTSPRAYSSNSCVNPCPAGTYNDLAASPTCQPCDSTCTTCSGSLSTQCLTCTSPRAYSSNTCINPCPAGTYNNLATPPTCQPCDSTCATCSGSLSTQCLTCTSPKIYTPSQNTCTSSCPAGTYNNAASPPTCQPCDSTCTTCSGSLSTQCLTCTSPRALSSNSCVNPCPAGTYNNLATPPTCQPCDSTCATCSGSLSTQCLTCTSPRIYYPSQNTCPLSCPAGTSANSATPPTCQGCDSTCATCSGSLSTQCLSCTSPKIYTPSQNTCTASCPAGTYNDLATPPKCQLCDSTCATCSGSLATQCLTCASPRAYSSGSCVNPCPTGTYNDLAAPPTCQSCHATCKTCSGPLSTQCLSCNSPRAYSSNSCVNPCPTGTYNDLANPPTCQSCHATCKTCSGSLSTQCLTCTSPRIYYPSQHTCSLSCPIGTYNDLATPPTCQPCDTTCTTCSGSLSTQCLTCTSPRIYYPTQQTCPLSCPVGTTANSASPPTCQSCDSTCATCSGSLSTQCLTCTSPRIYYPSLHTCSLSCPNGTYNDLATPPTCQPCSSGSSSNGSCKSITSITITPSLKSLPDPQQLQLTLSPRSDYLISNFQTLATIQINLGLYTNYTYQLQDNNNSTQFTLQFSFQEYIPSGTPFSLTFPQSLTSPTGESYTITPYNLSTYLSEYMNYSASLQSIIDQSNSASSSLNDLLRILVLAQNFLTSQSPSSITLIVVLQCVTGLKYLHINYPLNVIQLFLSKTSNSSGVIDDVPNYFQIYGGPLYMANLGEVDPPDTIGLYGVSGYYLDNMGQKTLIMIGLFVFGLMLTIVKKQSEKLPETIQHVLSAVCLVFAWNFVFNYFFVNYGNVMFYGLVQYLFVTPYTTDSFNIGVTIATILMSIYPLYIAHLAFQFIHNCKAQVRGKSDDEPADRMEQAYSILFADYNRETIWQTIFLPIYIFRDGLVSYVIVLLRSTPLQPAIMITCFDLMTIWYILYFKPLKCKYATMQFIGNEMLLIIAYLTALVFAIFDQIGYTDMDLRTNLGWLMYGSLYSVLVWNTVFSVRDIYCMIKETYYKIKESRESKKVHPEKVKSGNSHHKLCQTPFASDRGEEARGNSNIMFEEFEGLQSSSSHSTFAYSSITPNMAIKSRSPLRVKKDVPPIVPHMSIKSRSPLRVKKDVSGILPIYHPV